MSTEEKQELLISEIIGKGYDANEFESFVQDTYKHASLEEWSLEDLAQAIRKFQLKDDYFAVLKCKQSEEFLEVQSINITGYDKQVEGFFQNQVVYYHVQTFPQGWDVRRKYDEFLQLRNAVIGVITLPEIPIVRKIPVEQTFRKQLVFLQQFIQVIQANEELMSLKIVKDFLSLEKVQYTNTGLQSRSGDYGVRINDQIEQSIKQGSDYLSRSQELQKRGYKAVKEVMKKLSSCSQAMAKVADIYGNLHKITPYEPLNSSYSVISHLFQQWTKIQEDHIKIINETLYAQQRFQNSLLSPIQDITKARNKFKSDYVEFDKKLNQKKEKLFQQQEILKWDLDELFLDSYKVDVIKSNKNIAFQAMCKADNAQLKVLKNQFGYFNLRCYEAMDKYFQIAGRGLKDYGIRMSRQFALSMQQFHTLYADALNNLQQL